MQSEWSKAIRNVPEYAKPPLGPRILTAAAQDFPSHLIVAALTEGPLGILAVGKAACTTLAAGRVGVIGAEHEGLVQQVDGSRWGVPTLLAQQLHHNKGTLFGLATLQGNLEPKNKK